MHSLHNFNFQNFTRGDCPLVVGGDFNAVINPALDKSQSDTTANPS